MTSVPVTRNARSTVALELVLFSQLSKPQLRVLLKTLPLSQCVALRCSTAISRAAGRYHCDAYQRPNATSRDAGAYHVATIIRLVHCAAISLQRSVLSFDRPGHHLATLYVGILQPRVVEY